MYPSLPYSIILESSNEWETTAEEKLSNSNTHWNLKYARYSLQLKKKEKKKKEAVTATSRHSSSQMK